MVILIISADENSGICLFPTLKNLPLFGFLLLFMPYGQTVFLEIHLTKTGTLVISADNVEKAF